MSVKKIENFNIHEQPESNTDSFGVEAYLNANWEKTKEAVNNNAEELIQSQKDIDANKNDIENINSKNKSQDDTIEALKAENKLIKEQIPSSTVSGNSIIYIEDSSNLNFDWKIRGGHYQKQTIQNDNLLILEDTTITTNGITLTIKDGVITINGTSTASTNIDFKIKKKLKAGTYWHSVQRIGDAPSGNVGFLVMKLGGVIATINGRGGAPFTLNEDTEVFYRIWTDKNNIISNVAYKCLISEGSDSKPWVQGIPDSPSVYYPSEIETVGSNVNSFDGELESGSLANNTGQNYGNAKNTRSKNYLAVEENTTYALSDNINGSFIVHAYDKDKNWLKMIGASNYTGKYIFTTPTQTAYIRFRTNETDLTAKIKLERGSAITPYSPPGMGCVKKDVVNNDNTKSQTVIMPIQQEMLEGDYVADVEHHEWGKLVLTGNENFVQAQNANKLNYFYLESNSVKLRGKIISNMLKSIENGIIWGKTSYDDIVSSASNSKTINIMLSDTTITTLQQFKEKLKELYNAGTPIIIYYKLAESIDLELTSEQKAVREQKLYTYKNITNISVDNELASIEVEYKKDLETEHNKLQNEIDEIKQLISTTETSALLLDNLQKDVESEVE